VIEKKISKKKIRILSLTFKTWMSEPLNIFKNQENYII
jgi:hypothetical protein